MVLVTRPVAKLETHDKLILGTIFKYDFWLITGNASYHKW